MSSYVPEFSRIPEQDERGVHPQMRLATSERSFNESYSRAFSCNGSDTCVNLIYAGTSDEFPPEVTRRSGEKSARMRYRIANNSRDAWKSALMLERAKSKWLRRVKSESRVKRIHVQDKWTGKGEIHCWNEDKSDMRYTFDVTHIATCYFTDFFLNGVSSDISLCRKNRDSFKSYFLKERFFFFIRKNNEADR